MLSSTSLSTKSTPASLPSLPNGPTDVPPFQTLLPVHVSRVPSEARTFALDPSSHLSGTIPQTPQAAVPYRPQRTLLDREGIPQQLYELCTMCHKGGARHVPWSLGTGSPHAALGPDQQMDDESVPPKAASSFSNWSQQAPSSMGATYETTPATPKPLATKTNGSKVGHGVVPTLPKATWERVTLRQKSFCTNIVVGVNSYKGVLPGDMYTRTTTRGAYISNFHHWGLILNPKTGLIIHNTNPRVKANRGIQWDRRTPKDFLKLSRYGGSYTYYFNRLNVHYFQYIKRNNIKIYRTRKQCHACKKYIEQHGEIFFQDMTRNYTPPSKRNEPKPLQRYGGQRCP